MNGYRFTAVLHNPLSNKVTPLYIAKIQVELLEQGRNEDAQHYRFLSLALLFYSGNSSFLPKLLMLLEGT